MKTKLLVIGYFGYLTNQLDGQTIKTRNIYSLLLSKYDKIGNVEYFDTEYFQKSTLYIILMVWKIAKSNTIIYLPGENNLKYISPLIVFLSKLLKIDVFYFVVGGWLPEFLVNNKLYVYLLSKIKGIFPESNQLKDKLLHNFSFKNVETLPNFRIHNYVPSFTYNTSELKIAYMGRIILTKGIDVIFRLAKYFTEEGCESGKKITIDFFGPMEDSIVSYFNEEANKYDFVSYKGILQPDQVYNTLSKYDLVVLPTRYPGEGFPGTIIDSYISGVPVIVSNWKYLPEFVDEGKTGFVFDLDKESDFYHRVDLLAKNTDVLLSMKKHAFEKSKEYSSEFAWSIMGKILT